MFGIGASKGGSSNSYSQSSSRSQSAPGVWTPGQSYLLGAMERLDNYGYQPQYYQGNAVADESDWTRYGDETMAGAADQVGGNNVNARRAWNEALNATDLRNNPYVQQYADALRGRMHTDQGIQGRRISQQFNEEILPSLNAGAARAGGIGGSRQALAQAVAASRQNRDYQDYVRGSSADVQAQMGDLFNNAYNTGVQARGQALGYTDMLNQQEQLPGKIRYAIGGRQEQRQQQLIDADKERWDFAQNAPWQKLMAYAQMMGGLVPTGQDSTSTSSSSERSKQKGGWSFSI